MGSGAIGKGALSLLDEDFDCVGLYFGTPEAPCLTTIPIRSASFSVTKIRRELGGRETADVELPASNAYFLMLYLDDAWHSDIRPDGSRAPVRLYEKGSICLVDLRNPTAITLHSNLHALAFVLPRSLFDEVADISTSTKLHRLRCRRGEPDSVLGNLAVALLPLFENANMSPPALLQHLAAAVCAHLLHDYSDETLRNGVADSSLSVGQEKAAKEFMLDNLGKELSVPAIAAAVGLSVNHFSQEFRRATGFTPHQWLTRMRVDRAKELLQQRAMPLKAISDDCGFSDQSHFTKVFSRQTGVTPATWRSAWLN
ncbi:helix-turn-helix transcriptional regulator (plasmid) [Rhizobium grahamii]|uniref:Helix-turn-helix transcriptional regulator n=1 Tax=Rhizobium grahamii TaxID=1120045 RepID=A0A5Q0CDR6_9HYPH|nr:helix-turn-helix transcriptional regulator [Rhizobium grahamii]QRM51782.1 helix-turn-helix transcriptional regulator [Rhizobium sp. BG6]